MNLGKDELCNQNWGEIEATFGLVNNLGSLVVRLLFAPLEEHAFLLFSKLKNALASPSIDERKHTLGEMSRMLTLLIRLLLIIGLCFATFGATFSDVFLKVLYGTEWCARAALCLRIYCLCVLFLALNGITEAFAHAVASKQQLAHGNRRLIAFSAIYVALAWILLGQWGAAGLVIANCINMTMRISYSIRFIRRFFHDHGSCFQMNACLPSRWVFLSLGISLLLSATSFIRLGRHGVSHVVVGVICVAISLSAVFLSERSVLRVMWGLRRRRPQTSEAAPSTSKTQ